MGPRGVPRWSQWWCGPRQRPRSRLGRRRWRRQTSSRRGSSARRSWWWRGARAVVCTPPRAGHGGADSQDQCFGDAAYAKAVSDTGGGGEGAAGYSLAAFPFRAAADREGHGGGSKPGHLGLVGPGAGVHTLTFTQNLHGRNLRTVGQLFVLENV